MAVLAGELSFLMALFCLSLNLLLVLFAIGPGLLEVGRRLLKLENRSFLTFFTAGAGFWHNCSLMIDRVVRCGSGFFAQFLTGEILAGVM